MKFKQCLATLMIMVFMLGSIPMEGYAQGNNMGLDRDNASRVDYNSGVSFFTTKENIDESGDIIPYYWFELVAGVSDNYTFSFEQIPDNSSSEPDDVGQTPYITDAKFFDSQGNELSSTCTTGTITVLTPTSKLEKNNVYYIQAYFNSNGQAICMTVPDDTDGRHIRPTKSWEITYDLNGGTGTAPVDSEWYFGSDTPAYFNKYDPENDPAAPTQGDMGAPSGATFNGWNTEKNGSGTAYAVGDKIASTADVKLYAQWKTPSSSAYANSTVYTVNDSNHTVVGGSSSITTVTTVQQVLANMTFSEKATYKIVASGQDLSSVSYAAGAAAKVDTDKIVSGDQLVVIAENGIDYVVYTITAIDQPTAPTIGTLTISGTFTAGKNITLSNLETYIPTVEANSTTITEQGWQCSATSSGDSDSWTTWTVGVLSPTTTDAYKLRYYVTYGGTTITSNEVTLNVVGNATTLVLETSPASPQSTGIPITLTATLTGFLAGPGLYGQTITFKNGSAILGTADLNAGGVATYIWTPDSINTYSLTAHYAATYYNAAAASNTVSWQTTAAPTDWNGIIPSSNAGYTYSGGSGTKAYPYLIANSYDLAMLSSNVNTIKDYSVGKYFTMTANIDLNPGITVTDETTVPKEWSPIGLSRDSKGEYINRFYGTFDGGGFVVKGLYLEDKGFFTHGLFGNIENAKIQNLGITDSFVNVTKLIGPVGGIVGQSSNSTIENCYNTAKVIGNYGVGGISGSSSPDCSLINCYNTGEIKGNADIGGIIGSSAANVQDCYNTGSISGKMRAGGIAGTMADPQKTLYVKYMPTVIRCYNIGNVSSEEGDAGGIVGHTALMWPKDHEIRVDNCVSLGLSVTNESLNPLCLTACRVATGNGTISNAYARADMKVNGTLVSDGTLINSNGQNLVVRQSTVQDWSTWFGSKDASAWNFPTDGKLWFGAQLPTLKNVGGTQTPTLPGTDSGSTDTYTVKGTVKDKDSKPVTGATVTLTPNAGTPNPGTTGNDGKYTINDIPNGSYTISVILPNGGGTFTKNITVPDDISSGNIDLQQPMAQTYTVTYNGNNATSGSVSGKTTNVGTQTSVAANGFTKTGYTFTGWNTAANGSGTDYISGNTILSQTAGTTVTLYAQWTLVNQVHIVTGTVKDKDSKPVTGATVTLTPNAGTPNPATTGNDGKYIMNNVPDGSYTITVLLPNGGGNFTKNITVPDDISSGNIDLQQPMAQTYTVTYNGNNATSGSVSAQTTNVGAQTTVAANGFTKTGYTFTGWNTVANGSGTAYIVGNTILSQTAGTTVTLYAQWTGNTYEVSGTVKDNSGSAADGASVKLRKGNTQIGSHGVTTDSNGRFTITGVPNGIYNLVVIKDDVTVTTMIVVNNGNNELNSAITLPKGKTNSVVEIKPSTPDIIVGGLDQLFGKTATDNTKGFTAHDKNLVETSGGSVTIKLTAQSTDNTAPNATDIDMAARSNTKTIGAYLDLTVLKTAKDINGEEIHSQSGILVELPSLIEVRIPLSAELKVKTGYAIYRYHGSNVDEITTSPNKDSGEYFTVETDTVTLHIKKFSTYAIGYTTPASNNTGGGSGGHGNSSAVSLTITAEQNEGGKITISAKTASITPNDGYVIADVIVDGKSIGGTEKYTFTDSKAHKINAVFVKKTALPYYNKKDGKVYIGFSTIADKLYKYIAPAGVNVEYRENPKNFTDNTLDWAKPSIDFVTEREIFLGTTKDQFGPNESMTRGMFVTVIGRLYERSYDSISGTSTFSDVDADQYYAKYVAWANENGIIKGIGENKFAPYDQVTREQMAVIMLNFANFLKKVDIEDGSLTYADSTSISSWAINGAKYCQETKVITGREGGSFAPQESATRAEVAIVIERFIKLMLK